MLHYRTFRNTDPPLLAELWRSRSGQRSLHQPVSADLFEQLVFGKLHFDYQGMILAFDDQRLVGLVHASFGPDVARRGLATDHGVVCVLVVRPGAAEAEVAAGLLERAEKYLADKGARTISTGLRLDAPFYLGLYGGCAPPGILEDDTALRDALRRRGYREAGHTLVFQLALAEFRASIDRQQLQFRRRMMVQVIVDPPARDRWEACTLCDFDLTRFELAPRGGGTVLARATFRAMQSSCTELPGPAVGLLDVFVAPEHRRQGLAAHLLGEAFRLQAGQGVATVEAQAAEDNQPGLALFRKLGFQQAHCGLTMQKDLEA